MSHFTLEKKLNTFSFFDNNSILKNNNPFINNFFKTNNLFQDLFNKNNINDPQLKISNEPNEEYKVLFKDKNVWRSKEWIIW